MTYTFQDFTAGNVLTAAQMDQVEANIKDHQHGQAGVAAQVIPPLLKNTDYTLTASESGYHLYHTIGSAHTYTIPANGSVPFPLGTVITAVNGHGAGVLSIAITTDTLRMVGTSNTGTRAIAANGMATMLKVSSQTWYINGVGLT
jgi:hypothetical protein